jgi:hypothetical protein
MFAKSAKSAKFANTGARERRSHVVSSRGSKELVWRPRPFAENRGAMPVLSTTCRSRLAREWLAAFALGPESRVPPRLACPPLASWLATYDSRLLDVDIIRPLGAERGDFIKKASVERARSGIASRRPLGSQSIRCQTQCGL